MTILLLVRLRAFVISGVSKENTSGGLRCQFVSGFGREIGIVGTTEHMQVLMLIALVGRRFIDMW
jgi:hypothetical protein